jgi:hypothetical protein
MVRTRSPVQSWFWAPVKYQLLEINLIHEYVARPDDFARMHCLQARELQLPQEQEADHKSSCHGEVLQVVQEAYRTQRN